MTIFRTGKPSNPAKPRGEPPASGFALWTWAAQGPTTGRVAPPYVPPFHELPRPWATKMPEEVLADIRALHADLASPERAAREQADAEDFDRRHGHGAR